MTARNLLPTARDFLVTGANLAESLKSETRALVVASWPADWPEPEVVAHMLARMLADTDRLVSRGFVRMPVDRFMTPAKGRALGAPAADAKPGSEKT